MKLNSGFSQVLKAEQNPVNNKIELTVFHANGEQSSLDIAPIDLHDFIAVLSEFVD